MRIANFLTTTLLATLAVAVAGCVEMTRRTVPRGPELAPEEPLDRPSFGTGSKAGHGSRAPARGSLVTLPDIGDGTSVHRSGVKFPDQVGAFRRVRAYLADDGSASTAEYADGGGRLRIVASVRDGAGLSVAQRYEQVRAELESARQGTLPPLGDDLQASVLTGSTVEEASEGERQRLTTYRIEAVGPDFLEYRATYPASRQEAAVEAFDQFLSAHRAAE